MQSNTGLFYCLCRIFPSWSEMNYVSVIHTNNHCRYDYTIFDTINLIVGSTIQRPLNLYNEITSKMLFDKLWFYWIKGPIYIYKQLGTYIYLNSNGVTEERTLKGTFIWKIFVRTGTWWSTYLFTNKAPLGS